MLCFSTNNIILMVFKFCKFETKNRNNEKMRIIFQSCSNPWFLAICDTKELYHSNELEHRLIGVMDKTKSRPLHPHKISDMIQKNYKAHNKKLLDQNR